MQVLYPNDLKARKQYRLRVQKRQRRRRIGVRLSTALVAMIVLVAGGGVFSITRPIAAVEPSLLPLPTKTVAPLSLPWPRDGQAAVGAVGYGVLDQHKTDKPRPTASTAKIFTALMILKAKPLQPGQQGPMITVTPADEAIYHTYLAKGGSVYPVTAGEQISEYEALQALLLPSANNIADLLVRWAYGSVQAYTNEANEYFGSLGLSATTIADASGFAKQTVSTASDLTMAGELLLKDPVLAQIVSKSKASVPGVGVVHSTNVLLSHDKSVVGIKTGHTDEAGGCFVIAVKHAVNERQSVTLVATVMGAPDVAQAMKAAQQIVNDTKLGFGEQTFVTEGQVIARYQPGWSTPIEAQASQTLTSLVWLANPPEARIDLSPMTVNSSRGALSGTVSVQVADKTLSVPVVLSESFPRPPLSWRLYKRYL